MMNLHFGTEAGTFAPSPRSARLPAEGFPIRDHAVFIGGGLVAMLLGIFTALQLDVVLTAGQRLMNPAGQLALIKTTISAGLTGLLCWVLCALITRAISRAALKPYNALADHFERLTDGNADSTIELPGSVPAARRLARVVAVFHQKVLASQRSEAELQARYDGLYREHAGERRLLMGMLMSGQLSPENRASILHATPGEAATDFKIPDAPSFFSTWGQPEIYDPDTPRQ